MAIVERTPKAMLRERPCLRGNDEGVRLTDKPSAMSTWLQPGTPHGDAARDEPGKRGSHR